MNVGQICHHPAITVQPTDELRTAAKLMREHHIGFLVVVSPATSGTQPVGVLTDRDIVISALALDVEPGSINVGDIMTRNPGFALSDDSIEDALSTMRYRSVRRLPVIGPSARLMGVISLDDILRHQE